MLSEPRHYDIHECESRRGRLDSGRRRPLGLDVLEQALNRVDEARAHLIGEPAGDAAAAVGRASDAALSERIEHTGSTHIHSTSALPSLTTSVTRSIEV